MPPVIEELDRAIAAGEQRYRAGAHVEAGRIFSDLAARHPDHPTVLRLRGLCRLRAGDRDGALADLSRAHALAPEEPYAALHHGIALHTAARYAEAAALFCECVQRLPADPAPALNLAASRLMLADPEGALEAAEHAVRLAPALAQARYTLGLAQLACDEPALAAASFAEAVGRAPRFADAWVNLGLARYALADIAGAEQAMRQALIVAPGHPGATANLAVFLRLRGAAEPAEAMLRGLLARDPGAVEARLNLAAWTLQEEKPAEALALLQDPPPREPRARRHWDESRALALIQLGRPAEARILLDAMDAPAGGATSARPLTRLWRELLLARAERDEPAAQAAAAAMAARLDAQGEVLEHRIMAHFNLAKFWSPVSADRAFALWTSGHALLRRMQPFSRDAARAFTDACIARLDAATLRDGPRAGNADATPVFIVGMPRSGTTLLEQILAAHPAVHGAGERTALGAAFAALGGGDDAAAVARVAELDRTALDPAAERYLAELHALAPGAARIVDKMPGNYRHLGLVARLLPGARIIQCLRDPRDIGLSIFTFRFFGHHPYAHDLGDLGWTIAEYYRLMAHWRAALPNPVLAVELADWVRDFPGTLRRVLDFLDLPYDRACENFHTVERDVRTVSRAQVREPVHARGIGRWRSFAPHLAPLIEALRAGGVALSD